MDPTLVTLLVQIAADEAPAIIAAIHTKGGTVQDVGPILAQDAKTIDGDLQTLTSEQAAGDVQ
jgi:hypothetical protein